METNGRLFATTLGLYIFHLEHHLDELLDTEDSKLFQNLAYSSMENKRKASNLYLASSPLCTCCATIQNN